ncbi:AAA family ATPase [uncultured Nostoc sp.]|uniref:AAA family ATPase n=1 Tax=uncultured Nostoc sp. TaxID=340711 RepID=UPI0035CADACA
MQAASYYGEPGTGKTLPAHAIADRLGKPILLTSYGDIESKFHGEKPKNLQAIFYAAERNDGVLFNA